MKAPFPNPKIEATNPPSPFFHFSVVLQMFAGRKRVLKAVL
ncbi:hypothetical protein MNB_SUP05-SYMBIONT-7-584 [hydrothermal vent metagenome]|uniref:Uncharacterized protein n=1 Tax=hydrothermal vent metagenome TaxID=652676 RepID=A0A1W1E505_9ZZZZ